MHKLNKGLPEDFRNIDIPIDGKDIHLDLISNLEFIDSTDVDEISLGELSDKILINGRHLAYFKNIKAQIANKYESVKKKNERLFNKNFIEYAKQRRKEDSKLSDSVLKNTFWYQNEKIESRYNKEQELEVQINYLRRLCSILEDNYNHLTTVSVNKRNDIPTE
jgi:hypothetical protein